MVGFLFSFCSGVVWVGCVGKFFSSHPVFVSFSFVNEMTCSSPGLFKKEKISGNQEVSLNYCAFVNFRNRNFFALFFECQGPKFPKTKITKPKKLNAHLVTPKKSYSLHPAFTGVLVSGKVSSIHRCSSCCMLCFPLCALTLSTFSYGDSFTQPAPRGLVC